MQDKTIFIITALLSIPNLTDVDFSNMDIISWITFALAAITLILSLIGLLRKQGDKDASSGDQA